MNSTKTPPPGLQPGLHKDALLAAFPGLAALEAPALGRLLEGAVHRRLPAGTTIFEPGAPCGGYPLLLAGTVKVFQAYPNGRELQLYRVSPGEGCVLSSHCLLADVTYNAIGVTQTEAQLLVVPPRLFAELIATSEAFRRQVFRLLSERLAAMLQLVEAVVYQKLDQRLAKRLLASGDSLAATHQALADELGSVRVIVSRLLSDFQDHGWVKLGRERIEVRDRAALAALAAS